MENILIILAVLAILGAAAYYIYKEKKAGAACIGCPHAKSCAGKSCSCGGNNTMNK